ncbi:MAG: HD domain-containing protein [Clostridiales bacterium]|nr:HD domain-containing protein [Clostridiales bacterium]
MQDPIVEKAISYIEELFQSNADGHDAKHSMRVYKNAVTIADSYPEADHLIIFLASLLHDADEHKLFDTKENENAKAFLRQNNISETEIDAICQIINSVSFSKNKDKSPESLEGKIVQDADRLDALGAVGIARTFAYGGKHGRSLDDSIGHFHEKLLLLTDSMNTEEAKDMARKRHAFLLKFLEEYQSETN